MMGEQKDEGKENSSEKDMSALKDGEGKRSRI
jgi:hypothetical protein